MNVYILFRYLIMFEYTTVNVYKNSDTTFIVYVDNICNVYYVYNVICIIYILYIVCNNNNNNNTRSAVRCREMFSFRQPLKTETAAASRRNRVYPVD